MSDFQPASRLRGIQKSLIRQIFERARPGSINLGLGEPDLPTPNVIRNRAVEVVRDEQNGYTAHVGLPALREKVSADYKHLNVTQDDVIITAGSQEALYLSLMTLVDKGDEVLLPDPGFVAYPAIVKMAGGKPVYYKLPASSNFDLDLESFKSAITEKTRVVVVISPSNPTGRALSSTQLKRMAEALNETQAFVISDEIYREIYYTESRPPSISEYYPRTVVLSGLSKSLSMTGWRLGWMCGNSEVIKSAAVLHGYVTTCASTVSQKSALSAWTDQAIRDREDIRQIFKSRRDFVVSRIEERLGLRCVEPEGAFYTMVDVSKYGDSLQCAEKLLEHGVITVPGIAFGEESEGFLRLSFCADIDVLEEGLDRIKKALNG